MAEAKNVIEKSFSTGAVQATIWNNKGKGRDGKIRDFRTITLLRRYKDKSNEWRTTSSLRLNDLPRASLVLNKAYEYLVLKGQTVEEVEEEII